MFNILCNEESQVSAWLLEFPKHVNTYIAKHEGLVISATQVGGFSLSLVPLLHKQVDPNSCLTVVLQVRQSFYDGPSQYRQVLWQIYVQTVWVLS